MKKTENIIPLWWCFQRRLLLVTEENSESFFSSLLLPIIIVSFKCSVIPVTTWSSHTRPVLVCEHIFILKPATHSRKKLYLCFAGKSHRMKKTDIHAGMVTRVAFATSQSYGLCVCDDETLVLEQLYSNLFLGLVSAYFFSKYNF